MYNEHKHRTFIGNADGIYGDDAIDRFSLGFDLEELLNLKPVDLFHSSILVYGSDDNVSAMDEFDCSNIVVDSTGISIELVGSQNDITISKTLGVYYKEIHEKQGGGGGSVAVDSALSATSRNPVQNRVLTLALNGKTVKHLLSYDGNGISEKGTGLNYAQIHDMLMLSPDFVVLVYNDRAYHPNIVKPSEIVFVSTQTANGYITTYRVSITSNNVVTASEGSAEMRSNKVTTIADSEMYNVNKYPSNNAVMKRVHPLELALHNMTSIPEVELVGASNALATAHAIKSYIDGAIQALPFMTLSFSTGNTLEQSFTSIYNAVVNGKLFVLNNALFNKVDPYSESTINLVANIGRAVIRITITNDNGIARYSMTTETL